MHGAVDDGGCHLDALVSLYPVELLFIAWAIVNKCFIEPPTTFDSGVSSNQVVSLLFQQLKDIFGDQRFQRSIISSF